MKIKSIKQIICFLILSLSFFVTACNGSKESSNNGSNGGNSNSNVASLIVSGPSEFPAATKSAYSVTLKVTNQSSFDATNVSYFVPETTNYTSSNITVNPSGVNGYDCTNIKAGASCLFRVNIPANSKSGAFAISAISNNSDTVKVANVFKSSTKDILASDNTQNSSNLSLVSVQDNSATNYQYYILPQNQTLSANDSESVTAEVSVLIESGALPFESLNFVDGTGESLNFAIIGTLNTAPNSVNTFQIIIPPGVSVQSIVAISDSCLQLLSCSNTADVNIAESSVGILQVGPSSFSMNEASNTQPVVLNNIGNGPITALTLESLNSSIFNITDNTCGDSLQPGASCRFNINYTLQSTSGQAGFVINYNNGNNSIVTSATISYIGSSNSNYAIISASPNIVSLNSSNLSQTITLTNIGTANEVESPIISGVTSPLLLLNNQCTQPLSIGSSCSFTIYESSAPQAGSSAVQVSYNNGSQVVNIALSWASFTANNIANVIASPVSVAFSGEEEEQGILLTNIGSADATNLNVPTNFVQFDGESTTSIVPFGADTNCTSTLSIGDSCNYNIYYNESTFFGGNISIPITYTTNSDTRQTNIGVSWTKLTASAPI